MNPSDLAKLQAKLPISAATLARNPVQSASVPAPDTQQGLVAMRKTTSQAGLNKTEQRYLNWLLSLDDVWVGVQNITLKLAHDCRLTMDFAAVDGSGLRLIDTKACNKRTGKPVTREDALIKIRVAARQFPFIRFLVAWEQDGVWRHQEIKP